MYAFFYSISRVMAYLGGVMLTLLIVMTCLSIAGRSMNGLFGAGPITGDFELVEAGVAFAIFAFLPLCQITGNHATVDVFTQRLSPRADRILQMCIDLLFAAVLVVIAVQLFAGMQSKLRSGQTSFLIEFPVWWGYAACMIGAGISALVSVYIAGMRVFSVIAGEDKLPQMQGADT